MTPLCSRSGRMLSKCLPIMCNAHELGVPVACRDEFACASRPSEELSSGFEIGWSSLQVGSSGSAVLYLSVPSWQLTHAHVGPGGGAGRPDPRPAEATTTPPDSLESPIQGRVATPAASCPSRWQVTVCQRQRTLGAGPAASRQTASRAHHCSDRPESTSSIPLRSRPGPPGRHVARPPGPAAAGGDTCQVRACACVTCRRPAATSPGAAPAVATDAH